MLGWIIGSAAAVYGAGTVYGYGAGELEGCGYPSPEAAEREMEELAQREPEQCTREVCLLLSPATLPHRRGC